MKIESIDTTAEELLEGRRFLIPRFQRPYSWQKSDVEDFLEDIYTQAEEEYYIGSMVMYRDGTRNAVVDGQQRLSTIVVILCALRNHFDEQGYENLAEGIQEFIERKNKEAQLEFTLNTQSSYPYFQNNIMSRGQGNPMDAPDHVEELKIQAAFKVAHSFFELHIKSINQDPAVKKEDKKERIKNALSDFRDRLLSVKIVTITLDEEHDAYIVFETLNTRGVDLSNTDLIKNHVTRGWPPENVNLDKALDSWNSIV